MTDACYIEVILPVRLGWNPVYRVPGGAVLTPEGLECRIRAGDRVRVRLQGKELTGVVRAADIRPQVEESRIRDIVGIEQGLDPVTEEEMRLWEFMADYYMCTVGEVLKCAYPVGKVRGEQTAARVKARALASARRQHEMQMQRLRSRIIRLEERLASREKALEGRHSESVTARLEDEKAKLSQELGEARALLEALGHEEVESVGSTVRQSTCISGAPLSERQAAIKSRLVAGKPLLLRDLHRQDTYTALSLDYLASGKNVLHLVPDIAFTEELEAAMQEQFGDSLLIYHSQETEAQRREIAAKLRQSSEDGGMHYVVLGTRSAIFLPFKDLGLIIVDEEQDRSYKQDSPAPRYQARDVAVVMAQMHGAAILLGSATPSLETVSNCLSGRYAEAETEQDPHMWEDRTEVIDMAAERKKRGVTGQFSRKLIQAMYETLEAGHKVVLLRTWGSTAETASEVMAIFPDKTVACTESVADDWDIMVGTLAQTRHMNIADGSLIALLQADMLLGAPDFRADERAMQVFDRYREKCAGGRFVIQTSRSEHTLLQGAQDRYGWLLSERQSFGFPPYSRIIDIIIRDDNDKRRTVLSAMLLDALRATLLPPGQAQGLLSMSSEVQIQGPMPRMLPDQSQALAIRILLRRGKQLIAHKQALAECLRDFEASRKYTGHIHIDVDPD